MLNHFSHVRLSMILWTIALQSSLSMRFCRQEYWSRMPWPPPVDLSDPGIEPASPALQEDSLSTSHLGSPEMLIPGPTLTSIEWNFVRVGPRYRFFWKSFSKDPPMHLGLRTTALKHLKFNLFFYGRIHNAFICYLDVIFLHCCWHNSTARSCLYSFLLSFVLI